MRLMTLRETARLLSLSERTLYQWHWQGKDFPFVKLGRALRVSEPSLHQFIRNNRSKRGKKKDK